MQRRKVSVVQGCFVNLSFDCLVFFIAGVPASMARASGQNAAGRIVGGQESAKTKGGCSA